MNCYKIYYASQEFARVMGDPCLAIVEAESKQDAELLAEKLVDSRCAGLWAVKMTKEECELWKQSKI